MCCGTNQVYISAMTFFQVWILKVESQPSCKLCTNFSEQHGVVIAVYSSMFFTQLSPQGALETDLSPCQIPCHFFSTSPKCFHHLNCSVSNVSLVSTFRDRQASSRCSCPFQTSFLRLLVHTCWYTCSLPSLFLPFFLSSFLPFFLSSFLPFFLSSFLPFFLSLTLSLSLSRACKLQETPTSMGYSDMLRYVD